MRTLACLLLALITTVSHAQVRSRSRPVDVPAPVTQPQAAADDAEESPRMTYDLGFSTGSTGGRSYTEANLGLNAFLQDYFVWRNAVFARFQPESEDTYGLDSSARLILNLAGEGMGLTAFGGPGYRFATRGEHVPFAEGGLVFRLGGLSLGGGVKSLMHSWVREGVENDTQYFLILQGGGSL